MTETNGPRVSWGVMSERSGQRSRIMTATSMGRIVGPSLALVAACGAGLVYGITHIPREPPVETRAAPAAPAVSPPASGARDEGSAALATSQAEANAVAATPAAPARSLDTDESVPVFDMARIEPTGDAVIAGRAAPGAIVELLRNGERHDRAVADQSGQFVMVPPRLPPGDYELTLTSRQPDGKQTTSKQSVAVALQSNLKDEPVVASRAHQLSRPPLRIAKRQKRRGIAALPQPHAYAPPSIVDVPKRATGGQPYYPQPYAYPGYYPAYGSYPAYGYGYYRPYGYGYYWPYRRWGYSWWW